MSERPLLLDLYCKAGGCSVGYHRAGFDVVGLDHEPQKRYPFPFVQVDALTALDTLLAGGMLVNAEGAAWTLGDFAAIHASPPCQRFSTATFSRGPATERPDLVTPTIERLQRTGKVWVVENVLRAPLSPWGCVLCGLMFGLKVFRHRRFECSGLILRPEHPSHRGKKIGVDGMVCVAGHGDVFRRCRQRVPLDHRNKAAWAKGMGIDWMTRDELAQAIPPAYTHWIGYQVKRMVSP